jgi:hypothetical protein
MWFNNRKQVLTILIRQALIAVAAIIIAAVVCFFTAGTIVKISDSLQQRERLSKILAMRIENVRQLKNSLALLGENDKKIIALYPPTDYILDFTGALESLAKQISLRQTLNFGSFAPFIQTGGASLYKTDYSISLTGTITTLKTYLQRLEKISFITKIGAVNMLASPPNGWNGDSSITINGSLYAQEPR